MHNPLCMQGFDSHAWISHANKHFMHTHGQTCTRSCMHVCAYADI